MLGPIGERADLHEVELLVPADDRRLRPIRALVAANAAHPRVPSDRRLLQHADFVVEAALGRVGLVDGAAMLRFVFRNRVRRAFVVHHDAVALREAVAQLQRLFELVAGV